MWERELNAHPGVQCAAVIFEDLETAVSRLHMEDLLPEWNFQTLLHSQETLDFPSKSPATVSTSMVTAIAKGPELLLEDDAPSTLIDALMRSARLYPEHGVTYIRGDGNERFQSYPDLLDEAMRLLSGLRSLKLSPHAKIVPAKAEWETTNKMTIAIRIVLFIFPTSKLKFSFPNQQTTKAEKKECGGFGDGGDSKAYSDVFVIREVSLIRQAELATDAVAAI